MARVKEALMDACTAVMATAIARGVPMPDSYDDVQLFCDIMSEPADVPTGIFRLVMMNRVLKEAMGV